MSLQASHVSLQASHVSLQARQMTDVARTFHILVCCHEYLYLELKYASLNEVIFHVAAIGRGVGSRERLGRFFFFGGGGQRCELGSERGRSATEDSARMSLIAGRRRIARVGIRRRVGNSPWINTSE